MRVLIDGQTLLTAEINRGIGTYFKNVVEGVLEQDCVNDYYMNTAEDDQLKHLSPWARDRIQTISHQAYHPQNLDGGRDRDSPNTYTNTLNEDLAKNKIDLYWTPNPLMNNVFLPGKIADCRFAATIYDLIVLVMRDRFLDEWPSAAKSAYLKKLQTLETDYHLFLHISKHTYSDFSQHLNVQEKQHVVTPLAASEFFRPDPFPVVAGEDNYVIYIGGFDPRKNMDLAVQAFAKLHERYAHDERARRTQLYIVCNVDAASKSKLLKQAGDAGVNDRVKLTGFVDNYALRSLYQKARCLFFPSLYEGFGLPILEALACGLPAASSNSSSLPEVGGEFALYFDPQDVNDMASVLCQTLNEPMDLESRWRRHHYSRQFSWEKTAAATLQAFADCTERSVGMTRSVGAAKV
jgi:glycosyltransferase involved in cell wall biosynthesis